MIPEWKMYPRSQGHSTVYLQNVVHSDFIEIGDYTTYDDFEKDPRDFQRNNVLYHYPECNHDKLIIGKFCSSPAAQSLFSTPQTTRWAVCQPIRSRYTSRNGNCRRMSAQ